MQADCPHSHHCRSIFQWTIVHIRDYFSPSANCVSKIVNCITLGTIKEYKFEPASTTAEWSKKRQNPNFMKNVNSKVIAGCILLLFLSTSSFSQTAVKKTKAGGKQIAKVEKAKVPKEVNDIWIGEYPAATYVDWYGYPAYDDYVNNWYYDWYDYDYDPYIYSEYPEYYVVEFNKDNTPHKAVYSKAGKKMATHKKLTSDLPQAVSAALNRSAYKGWKVGKDKEEIFKDSDMDQLKVYKVDVEKGSEKHVLYFQNDGKLLKDKKLMSK